MPPTFFSRTRAAIAASGQAANSHLGRTEATGARPTGGQHSGNVSKGPAGSAESVPQRRPLRPAWSVSGPWQHVEVLHEGALTVIFRVRPITGGEPAYVLKCLQPHWADDPRAVAMLFREAAVGQALHHRNLVPVLDTQLSREPRFVVTPLLEGQSLETQLAAKPRPGLAQVLWIVRQVAEALGSLDAAGWLHGDVKPSNIVVSPRGHATLIDLGFARRRDEIRCEPDRPVLGTPQYMAPEMLLSRLRPDIRSDLYSLGAVMYRLLAGRLPFEGNDAAAVLEQQLQCRPRALRELNRDVPEAVSALVQRLLAKDPLRRPASPVELVRQLVALELAHFEARE